MNPAVAEPLNVAAHLPRLAAAQPEALAVAVATGRRRFETLSCAELDQLCDRSAHALRGAGIDKGTRTVVMVPPSLEFFAITFALFKIGAIPVTVDPPGQVRRTEKLGQTTLSTSIIHDG